MVTAPVTPGMVRTVETVLRTATEIPVALPKTDTAVVLMLLMRWVATLSDVEAVVSLSPRPAPVVVTMSVRALKISLIVQWTA